MDMSPLLQLSDVTKSFGGLVAVNRVSMEIQDGEILGLIGPNGAGKSTLFNTIAGVYRPNSGRILFEGKEINGKKPHVISQLGISRTFQTVRPLPRMTVIENTMMGGLFGRNHMMSVGAARRRAQEVLGYMDLDDKSDVLAADLTLAEQRRLELARSLAAQPKLLMLDEVMAGLNLSEISNTLDLLSRLHKERQITLLVIEHVMKAVMKLCRRIIVMDHGTIIAQGTPSEIVTNDEVIKAYMGTKSVAVAGPGTATSKSPNEESDLPSSSSPSGANETGKRKRQVSED
ncbi:MAG TPA: ABC transporter ATP-binding protein [Nitrososphaerales archaeon]|nr:ABC transporter ATP-binding protein [Nitrososphaerales archaeon]